MKFDSLIETIGGFGKFQKRVLFLLYLDSIMCAFHGGITVFILPNVDHRCSLEGYQNDTYEIQGAHHEWLINQSIPLHMENYDKEVYSPCKRFRDLNNTEYSLEKCNSWVFDKSIYKTTLPEEFNLVCDQKMMLAHIVTAFYLGILVGALITGIISDWIGRKILIIACILTQGIAGIASAFSQTVLQMLIFRFFIGFGSVGVFVTSFVLCIELVETKKRSWASMGTQIFYAIGFCILAGVAYFLRDWRTLIIVLSTPSILLSICLIWCIPESPRLLFLKNKKEKAFKIIKSIAKTNGVFLPEDIEETEIVVQQVKSFGTWKVCTSKQLFLQNVVMGLNWISVSLCYFALAISSGDISGDTHLNFFLGAIVEFPAYFITVYLLDRKFGRRTLLSSTMIGAGCALFISAFPFVYAGPDLQWLTLVFCLLGRMSITAAFGIIFLYVCEIYPTVARNGALGIFSTLSRIGSSSAPYIMSLGDYVKGDFGKGIPLIILAAFALIAGPPVMLLPESSGKSIPDTVEEAASMQRSETRQKNKKHSHDSDVEMIATS